MLWRLTLKSIKSNVDFERSDFLYDTLTMTMLQYFTRHAKTENLQNAITSKLSLRDKL